MGTEVYPPLTTLNTSAQPIAATVIAANKLRRTATLGNLTTTVTFYFKKGLAASATNFDFFLAPGNQAAFDDYVGDVTCSPVPTAGQLNVSESAAATS